MAPALLVAGPLVAAPVLAVWLWRRDVRRRLEHSRLNVAVARDPAKRGAPATGLVTLLELDPAVASAPPLDGLRLLSLGSYFASLSPAGSVSFERALVSIADGAGLAAALPLAMFLPPALRADGDVGGLLAGLPALAAGRLAAAALTPLDLVAFSQAANRHIARALAAAEDEDRAREVKARKKQLEASAGGGCSGTGASANSAVPEQQQQQQQGSSTSGPPANKRRWCLPWRRGLAPEPPPLPSAAPARVAGAALHREGPLDLLRRGGGCGGEPLAQLPSPLVLTAGAVRSLLGLTPEDVADKAPAPLPDAARALSPLLPDLYIGDGPGPGAAAAGGEAHTGGSSGGDGDSEGGGNGAVNGGGKARAPGPGLRMTHGRGTAAVGALMANVFNRLTANGADAPLPGVDHRGQHGGEGTAAGDGTCFGVSLSEGGPMVTSPEDLVEALAAAGHTIELELVSSLTSFGVGLSVHTPEAGWQHVPMAFPLSTGLWAPGKGGAPAGDVLTLTSHASVRLRCRGPSLSFDLEYCLAVGGFTGWLAFAQPYRPWLLHPHFTLSHALAPPPATAGPVTKPAARRRVLRLLAASACALNAAGQRDRLLLGGYGLLGVCLDSVAAVQQAATGACTLYPLLLGGAAKVGLVLQYRAAAAAGWRYAAEARDLAAALVALPCDALPEPSAAAGAARRALACLPSRCVFGAVARCRAGLQAALAAAEGLAAPLDAPDGAVGRQEAAGGGTAAPECIPGVRVVAAGDGASEIDAVGPAAVAAAAALALAS